MHKPRLFIIDATALCYRAFYAIRSLSTSSGRQTNAVYGFIRMLQKIIKEQKPEYVAVCFDVSRVTFRQEKFAAYKAQREAMPDGLKSQIPIIKDVLKAYSIRVFEQEGFEADDVIATLVSRAAGCGVAAVVVSADKDLMQLVDDNTVVLNPSADNKVFDKEGVTEKFGLPPAKIADLIALIGDSVDNIPAVKGISEKRAVEFLRQYANVEELLEHIEDLSPLKVRQAVAENAPQIRLNKELAVLRRNVEIDFDLKKLSRGEPDYGELARIFKELEFKALLKDLPGAGADHISDTDVKRYSAQDFKGLVSSGAPVFIYHSADAWYFLCRSAVFSVTSFDGYLGSVLADPNILKVGHDCKNLIRSLSAAGIRALGFDFDVMIAAYLVNPARSQFSLADLAWEFEQKNINAGVLTPGQALLLIERLYERLKDELAKAELTTLFRDIEMPLVSVLARMETCGLVLDTNRLETLSRELEDKLALAIRSIYRTCGCEFNLNSPKQLREVLFERLKLPVIKRTKTGPSTDEEVLRVLAEKHPFVEQLLDYRQYAKLKSTYVDALPELVNPSTGRLHTTFNQTGTETGRLSSSNPNMQNLPIKTELGRGIREAITAFDKDSALIAADYSQIELRVLAHMSQDHNLLESFRQDKDVHRRTAAVAFGVAEQDVTGEMRMSAKRINFGIVYGLSSFGLSKDLGIPVAKAQRFIDAYFATYPGVKKYMQEQIEFAREHGFVKTIFGRRRYLPEIRDKNMAVRQFAQRQAINTPIQGSASDLIKLAMAGLQAEIDAAGLPYEMFLQVHDELLFNVPKAKVTEAAVLIRKGMENVISLSVPVKVDIAAGGNWAQMRAV